MAAIHRVKRILNVGDRPPKKNQKRSQLFFLRRCEHLHATDLPLSQRGSIHKVRQHREHVSVRWLHNQMHPGRKLVNQYRAPRKLSTVVQFIHLLLQFPPHHPGPAGLASRSSPSSASSLVLPCPLTFSSPSPLRSADRALPERTTIGHNAVIHASGAGGRWKC